MRTKSSKLALRVLSTATFLAMVSSCATAAFADTYDLTKGSVTVNAKNDGTYVTQKDADGSFCTNESGKTLDNYKDETPVTLTSNGTETDNTAAIYTEKGVSTTVTLDNVNIDASKTQNPAIYTGGNVTLELDGDNTLTGGEGRAALEKYSNARGGIIDKNYTLTLQDETTGDGKTGSLTATGGAGGAGIGGACFDFGGNKVAGGYANNITITGGTITANGGTDAAGIGGGRGDGSKYNTTKGVGGGNGSNITISGANTIVTANGGENGAGIGGKGDGGSRSGQGLNITIRDGAHVTANGGAGGAGIGGGGGSDVSTKANGLCTYVTITGDGTYVKATGGTDAAGIGGGKKGQGQSITIDAAATVIASGTGGGAGIGGGSESRGCNIFIQDGKVTATGGAEGGSGIGGGSGNVASIAKGGSGVTISGGTVNATGGAGAAGIGSGADNAYSKGSYVSISGGDVTANGGTGAAGIGDGVNNGSESGSNITITGGTIKANAGKGDAAGIGNGANDAVDATVTINANDNELNVAATTRRFGEAITGENDLTMADLGNEHSGVVRSYRKGWIFTYLNNTVHNGKYVGMEDNNQDLHQEDDAHIWGRSQIIKYATPDEQGTIRHYCSVDGCKGYYDEPYDYVEPSPDEPTPVTPVTPVTPETPDTPAQDETPDSTPADTTPAEDITVTPADVADTAQDETAAVTPAGAQSTVQADTASTLPQTGVNWLAAVGSAISGLSLLTAGLFLNRKESKH